MTIFKNINIAKFLIMHGYEMSINALIPTEFKSLIEKRVKERKQNLIKSQNLCLTVKPEFMTLFKNSQSVSLEVRKSHFLARLLKKTNEKKKIDEYEEDKKISDHKTRQLENKKIYFMTKSKNWLS